MPSYHPINSCYITNIKASGWFVKSVNIKEKHPLVRNFKTGNGRIIFKLTHFTMVLMSYGKFLNITGFKQLSDLKKGLKLFLAICKDTPKISYFKIDSISICTHINNKNFLFKDMLDDSQGYFSQIFEITKYPQWLRRINLRIKPHSLFSSNLSANLFSSGRVMLFGVLTPLDSVIFLNEIFRCSFFYAQLRKNSAVSWMNRNL